MTDYQIMLNALDWFEKGVLTEEDLAETQTAIDVKNIPQEETEEEENI